MKRAGPVALWVTLLLAAAPVLVGCSSDPTCADVDRLQKKLDGLSTDDPDYNTVNEELNQAEADCNT